MGLIGFQHYAGFDGKEASGLAAKKAGIRLSKSADEKS
jgi:hypothetical protein